MSTLYILNIQSVFHLCNLPHSTFQTRSGNSRAYKAPLSNETSTLFPKQLLLEASQAN